MCFQRVLAKSRSRCQNVQQRKRQILQRPESMIKMKKKITQKVWKMLMMNKQPYCLLSAKRKRHSRRISDWVDEKQRNSAALPRQEAGNAVHVRVCVPANVHDTKRSSHSLLFIVADVNFLCRAVFHGCSSFLALFVFP